MAKSLQKAKTQDAFLLRLQVQGILSLEIKTFAKPLPRTQGVMTLHYRLLRAIPSRIYSWKSFDFMLHIFAQERKR
jgi:hypothetical protein